MLQVLQLLHFLHLGLIGRRDSENLVPGQSGRGSENLRYPNTSQAEPGKAQGGLCIERPELHLFVPCLWKTLDFHAIPTTVQTELFPSQPDLLFLLPKIPSQSLILSVSRRSWTLPSPALPCPACLPQPAVPEWCLVSVSSRHQLGESHFIPPPDIRSSPQPYPTKFSLPKTAPSSTLRISSLCMVKSG